MRSLITPEYAALNRQLHDKDPLFGATTGTGSADTETAPILDVIRHYAPRRLLDYGSGKGVLTRWIRERCPGLPVVEYDPAFETKNILPEQADLIIAWDVMEHIEPECLDNVLEAMHSLRPKAVMAWIACKPARRVLPDGRNAHLIVQPPAWWAKRFQERFTLVGFKEIPSRQGKPSHCVILAEPK